MNDTNISINPPYGWINMSEREEGAYAWNPRYRHWRSWHPWRWVRRLPSASHQKRRSSWIGQLLLEGDQPVAGWNRLWHYWEQSSRWIKSRRWWWVGVRRRAANQDWAVIAAKAERGHEYSSKCNTERDPERLWQSESRCLAKTDPGATDKQPKAWDQKRNSLFCSGMSRAMSWVDGKW